MTHPYSDTCPDCAPGSRRGTRRAKDPKARILDAVRRAIEDADDVDALLMRDIVEKTGYSIGTVYRYFAGRDHLVAELQFLWVEQLEGAGVGERNDDTLTVLLAVAESIASSLELSPKVARAAISAGLASSPEVRECARRLDLRIESLLASVVVVDEVDPVAVVGPMRLAWHGAVALWARDLVDVDELRGLLEQTCRSLVAGASRRGDSAQVDAGDIAH